MQHAIHFCASNFHLEFLFQYLVTTNKVDDNENALKAAFHKSEGDAITSSVEIQLHHS